MYILGLATMTDSSAVLMRDGHVVAAAEEERFSRIKHDGGFPYRATQFTLNSEGISIDDVDHIAVYWYPYKLAYRARYMLETMVRDRSLFAERFRRSLSVW